MIFQFSHLIDENTGSKFDMIGSGAVSNKDNARESPLSYIVAHSIIENILVPFLSSGAPGTVLA